MPTLQFMPWCRIEKPCRAGDLELVPFRVGAPIDGIDESTSTRVGRILACYRDLEGRPVEKAALARFGKRSLAEELGDSEIEVTREIVDLVCFSGLSNRAHFRPDPYCNADCFTLYTQKFEVGSDFTALVSRRRDGRTLNGRSFARTVISVPHHVGTVRDVALDEHLLVSLVAFQEGGQADEWGRWQSSISCFNQANTDNDSIRQQVEWVLLCGAFEHILEAEPKAKDVAERFAANFAPSKPLLARDSRRKTEKWAEPDRPVCYEWMKEFYRIRGDFAHGKTSTRQPASWSPEEHLVLAAIAFPLLVRLLLRKTGLYELTIEDSAQIESFEKLADAEFLRPPADQQSNLDSIWSRLVGGATVRVAVRQAAEELASRKPGPRPESPVEGR